MNTHGFTLIETLVYLALLSMLLSGSIISAYAMAEAVERTRALARVEFEGSFLLHTMHSSLQGAAIQEPLPFSTSDRLSLLDDSGGTRTYKVRDGILTISDSNGTRPLSGYSLSAFSVSREGVRDDPEHPEYLRISLTLLVMTPGGARTRDFENVLFPAAP